MPFVPVESIPAPEATAATTQPPTATPTAVTVTATNAEPEKMSDLIDAVARNADGLGKLVDRVGAQFNRADETESRRVMVSAWMGFAFMLVAVIVCAWLVFMGRMSDGAFTFLLGVMVAYMMRFVERLDFGGGD